MPRVCISVSGKNAQPYRFSLDRKIIRLGRAADNDIIVDCPSVSSHHCEMRRVEGGYILKDLDSTNGIKAGDDRMEVIDLENDMELSIGDASLEFELTDEEIATLEKEDHEDHSRPKLPPKAAEPEEDLEERPRRARPRQRRAPAKAPPPPPAAPLASAQQQNGALSFLIGLVFLVVGLGVFFVGMSTAHESLNKKLEEEEGAQHTESLWTYLFGESAEVDE